MHTWLINLASLKIDLPKNKSLTPKAFTGIAGEAGEISELYEILATTETVSFPENTPSKEVTDAATPEVLTLTITREKISIRGWKL